MRILCSAIFMFEILTKHLTNDVVSFEQLGPDCQCFLVFSHLGFQGGTLVVIVPDPDHCYLYSFIDFLYQTFHNTQ